MKIGGGGWVVGMDIHPTAKNLIYARTDVSGAYRWDAAGAVWKRIVSAQSMPAPFVAYGKYPGVDSLVGAPSDPDIAYMAFAGEIFRSTDRGEHWTATGFLKHKVETQPNGSGRQEGERLAIDPRNPAKVYFGSVKNGLWLTEDSGANWRRVEEIPAGTADHGVNTIVYGKEDGVIYVSSDGTGIYRSADAGATWARISGPGEPSHANGLIREAVVGPDGTYYVGYDRTEAGQFGAVWKYTPAAGWTDITPPLDPKKFNAFVGLAVEPGNARHVVVLSAGGACHNSTDQGKTWTTHGFKFAKSDTNWVNTQTNYWLSVGEIAFDPHEPGKLWFAEGLGVWWTKEFTGDAIEWHFAGHGIEETCGNDVIAPPGGKPVGAMFDMGLFRFPEPDTYSAQRSPSHFMSAWALDWCPADPNFLVGVLRNHLSLPPHPNMTGFSTDGGVTWQMFPAVEKKAVPDTLEYGVIAVAAQDTAHIVWAPAGGPLPYFTKDRGATWTQSSFGGPTTTGLGAFYGPRKPLAADRVLPDTYYFYRNDDAVYRSTDGGVTFTKAGNPISQRYNPIMKTAPGHAGHLWFAEGSQGNPVGGLWRSTDGAETWKALPYIEQAYNVGLGKPARDGGYPTLFVAGVAEGKTGIFRSIDEGQTWNLLGSHPLGVFDWIDAMDGDKDVFGKVYLAFTSTGFAYGAEKTAASE